MRAAFTLILEASSLATQQELNPASYTESIRYVFQNGIVGAEDVPPEFRRQDEENAKHQDDLRPMDIDGSEDEAGPSTKIEVKDEASNGQKFDLAWGVGLKKKKEETTQPMVSSSKRFCRQPGQGLIGLAPALLFIPQVTYTKAELAQIGSCGLKPGAEGLSKVGRVTTTAAADLFQPPLRRHPRPRLPKPVVRLIRAQRQDALLSPADRGGPFPSLALCGIVWLIARPLPRQKFTLGSTRTFVAFMRCMLDRELVAIALCVFRAKSTPTVCALVPQVSGILMLAVPGPGHLTVTPVSFPPQEETFIPAGDPNGSQDKPPGIHVIPFPFLDDMREYPQTIQNGGALVRTSNTCPAGPSS